MTERLSLGDGCVALVESSPVVPLVSIVLAWRSGATSDPPAKDGICRFAARMLRRGIDGMTASEIETAIDTLGGELGLDVGPSTMSLHAQVIRRNLKPFIDLLARIVGKPAFADDEIARLRRETAAELVDARDSDRSLGNIALRRALFAGHAFARGAAGRISTVETFTRDDVLAAYKRHFVRSDLVIGFAGAITTEEATSLGAELAGAIAEGTAPSIAGIPEPERPKSRRLVFVDKPERSQTPILIGTLGSSPHDPDHFPLVLATAVFGGTFTSRMMREIRSKRGWSYGTSARLAIERRRHAFTMSAAPGAADCAPCLKLELELLEQLVEKGITARELAFIKNYLVRSHAFEIDTAPKRLGQAIEVEVLGLPTDYHSRFVEHVKSVELDASNASLKERLTPNELVIAVVGTASDLFDEVKAAIPNLSEAEVVPFDRD
jgi:zinc protease